MPPSKRTKRSMDSLANASSSSSSSAAMMPPPSKRKVVKIASDADEVLAQCHKLRDELRKKQMKRQSIESGEVNNKSDASSDEDEWGIESSDDDTKKKKTLKKQGALKTDGASTNKNKKGDAKSKPKTQQLSLAELNRKRSATTDADDAEGKQTIVEVVEMSSTEVMEGIENVAMKIAHQVLAKQGFQLDIPCE